MAVLPGGIHQSRIAPELLLLALASLSHLKPVCRNGFSGRRNYSTGNAEQPRVGAVQDWGGQRGLQWAEVFLSVNQNPACDFSSYKEIEPVEFGNVMLCPASGTAEI